MAPVETSQAPVEPQKRKVGGQPRNTNAVKHGAYLNEARRTVRATRDKHRRAAEREASAVLKGAGQEGNPLARLVAKQIRRLETIASRLEDHLERRGWFTKKGEPAPAMRALVDAVDRLLGEARTLLEKQPPPAPSGPVDYRVTTSDGIELDLLVSATATARPPVGPNCEGAELGRNGLQVDEVPSGRVEGPDLDASPRVAKGRPEAAVSGALQREPGSVSAYVPFPGSGWESDEE